MRYRFMGAVTGAAFAFMAMPAGCAESESGTASNTGVGGNGGGSAGDGGPSTCEDGPACGDAQTWAPSCSDGVSNGSETDVDCGGTDCADCADGQACSQTSDCQSGVCSDGICLSTTCTDDVLNGSETDTDCGGGACADCSNGQTCSVAADCQSSVCSGGLCAACTGDTDCPPSMKCEAGICVGVAPNGAPCTSAAQCSSGFCADGVCCTSACVGACNACSVAAGAAVDGVCGFLPSNTACRSPQCAGDATETCTGSSAECPAACGCQGQSCCGDSCGNQLTCAGETCQCGSNGQACCDGVTCSAGVSCNPSGMCVACQLPNGAFQGTQYSTDPAQLSNKSLADNQCYTTAGNPVAGTCMKSTPTASSIGTWALGDCGAGSGFGPACYSSGQECCTNCPSGSIVDCARRYVCP